MRKPISPRVGTRNSSRTQPVPWLTMFSMRPLRRASIWVTTPRKSSGTSIESRSIGSCSSPSTSRVTTCGLPTVSSKPSRRIVSTSTASCSSPRPCTSQVSRRSVSSTRIATLPTSSCSSRSCTMRAVSREPDWPASGELLIPIVTPSAGSSIAIRGSGRGSSGSAIVSPIVISGMPARAMISPGPASSAGTRASPSFTYSSATCTFSTVPSRLIHATCWPLRIVAVVHAAEREPADVGVGVEVRHARLKRVRLVVRRGGDALDEQVEQRAQVGALHALLGRGPAGLGVRVDDRELDLLLVRVEVEEQLVDLVHHLADARVRAVHLVHDEHHRQARPRAPCAARSGSAAAGPRRRRRAASRRRPSSARARPRRRSRRGRACRRG